MKEHLLHLYILLLAGAMAVATIQTMRLTVSAAELNLLEDGDLGDDDNDDLWNGSWKFADEDDDTWSYLGETAYNEWAANDTKNGLGMYFNATGTASFYQQATLEAGDYTFSGYVKETNGKDVQLLAYFGDKDNVSGESIQTEAEFQKFSFHFSVDEDIDDYKTGLLISAEEGAWVCLDSLSLTKDDTETESESAGELPAVEAGIFADKLDLDDDFIKGADISSYLSLEKSGVQFHNWDGTVVDSSGFFHLLKESGLNWVRIRVWNDPYDNDGNGYGGGNNDIETAKVLGKYASDAGLSVLIDFHYSDFWADPGMQAAPKAWEDLNIDEKADAVYAYTLESLQSLQDAGVSVGMIQIGNETNNGICGETNWENRARIYNAGAKAARDFDKNILVAVHFTEPNTGIEAELAENLKTYDVDYDVFATSYYPFWHGTLDNLKSVLNEIAAAYDKKVMVAETSYAYTYEDGDGHENNVSADKAASLDLNYNVSIQGQADAVRDVMKTIGDTTNGIGVFYWEPAWIPVKEYVADDPNAEEVLASNEAAWEKYGSGWASSYSAQYDPENAGRYYGGSSWDNQALFDHNGYPLESLHIFKYVDTGALAEVKPDFAEECSALLRQGEEYILPSTVTIINNDGSRSEAAVTWDEEQLASLDVIGSATVYGTAEGLTAICNVEILPRENLIQNGEFEDGLDDGNGWIIHGDPEGIIKLDTKDIKRGTNALKFDAWSSFADDITISQTVTDMPAGIYECFMYVEGGGVSGGYTISLLADNGTDVKSDEGELQGWFVWDKVLVSDIEVKEGGSVTVTIQVHTSEPEIWGTIDDVFLYKVSDLPE